MSSQINGVIQIKETGCKACGICYNLCPTGALSSDKFGKVIVKNQTLCISCRFCEDHCPDYIITIGGTCS